MLSRNLYNSSKLSDEQLIQVFSDAWNIADRTLIDELDSRSLEGRKRIEMSLDDFIHWLKRCSTFSSFSFADGKVVDDGRKMFTAFVSFDDPVVKRKLFGWAHVPSERAQSLIHRYGLLPR